MILKLGMVDRGLKFYKVCINDGPGLTLKKYACKDYLSFQKSWGD